MYTPSFKVRDNCIPVLSKSDIETIGRNFILDFCPEALVKPQAIDIDGFVEMYLGMTLDFQYLSNDGRYLGMTVFNDTNKVIIFDPQANRAEYLPVKARTVIIDNTLLEGNQRHRYRYTMGHEGSHDILHSGHYAFDPNQMSFLDDDEWAPMVQCRSIVSPSTLKGRKSDEEWMEWQANYLSSVLLMPADAVKMIAAKYDKVKNQFKRTYSLVKEVADTFDVSAEAATYRLKELKCLDKEASLMDAFF